MYTALAAYYDGLMSDVDYDGWTKRILGWLGTRDDGADLACGTGAITVRLLQAGKKVFGLEQSADMLARATVNASAAGVRALFVQGDMQRFAPPHKLGFVTCICDGVNYLADPSVLFGAVYAALRPGGIFIFDISSAYKLRTVLGNRTFCEETDDVTYIWRNTLSADAVDMELTLFGKEGERYVRSKETQRQYVHETDALVRALRDTGFSVRVFGEKNSRPAARAERIWFTAEKGTDHGKG